MSSGVIIKHTNVTTHVGAHPSGAKTLRDHLLLPSGTMGRSKYGVQTHFVKWDDETAGGRWYECTIGEKMSDGKYSVRGHEGSEGRYEGADLVAIGNSPSIGDPVLAYWQGYNIIDYDYAFLGRVTGKKEGQFWVVYQDGSEEWVPENEVHKLQRM